MLMKLTILGTATPFPRPDNACSGYLLQQGSTSIWVDAGTGTLAELQRTISLERVDAIWISHGHADHCADLLAAYYALRFGEVPAVSALPLIGPPGLRDQLVGFLGHRSAALLPDVFDITEMSQWGELTVGDIELSWSPVNHGMPAFGLRATAKSTPDAAGTVFAYSGDTAYCDSVVELAQGAHLLLCEVGAGGHEDSAVSQVHCSPEVAARIATEARVKRLVLTHINSAVSRDDARSRAEAEFDGGIFVATTGATFEIG